jgi:hypothetical protein
MSFLLESVPGQQVPRIVELPLAAASAFEQGALLLVNGSAQFAECGVDPASIAAVAATNAGADTTGFNILGKKEFPGGFCQGIMLATNPGARFRARYVGTLPGADGGVYGVIRDTDAKWKVDFADVTLTRVKLVDRFTNSPENQAEVVVTFLAANIQAY